MQRSVHGTTVEGNWRMRHAILHPIECCHERLFLAGRPRSTVREREQPFRDQQDILTCLQQRKQGALLVHEGPIARGTPAVLRRTVACASGAGWIPRTQVARHHALKANIMDPIVAHIVFVDEALTVPEPEVGKSDLERIVVKPQAAFASDPIVLAMHAKAMQMQVLPTHGGLEHGMQVADARITGDQQSPPNHGRNVAQRDLELIHRDERLLLASAHILLVALRRRAVFGGCRSKRHRISGVQKNDRFPAHRRPSAHWPEREHP